MRTRLPFLAALLVALTLTGCATGPSAPALPTIEDLEEATVVPWEVQVSAKLTSQGDGNIVQLSEMDPAADGWQLRWTDDDGATWQDEIAWGAQTMFAPSGLEAIYADDIEIRFRPIYDGGTSVGGWRAVFSRPAATSTPGTRACANAFEKAEEEAAAGGADETALKSTLRYCRTVESWVSAATSHPGAFGYTRASRSDAVTFLGILCRSYAEGICVG